MPHASPAPAWPPRPSTPQPAQPPLSLREIYRGRNVLILGATGFVGKVLLSMLLERFPELGRVYVMVRRGSGTDSETRFWNSVVPSPTFDPLRSRYGGVEGLAAYLRQKVRVVDGDITEPNLGMTEEGAQAVAQDIDVIINSSGKVTFNPPLEASLRTNVEGTKNVIAFARRMKRPALLHTSTCFVAGNRSGPVWEDEPLQGYFPRWRDMPGTVFSVEREIADSDRIAAEVRAQADDAQVLARLRAQARARLEEQGRNPDDEGALKLTLARERKDWVRQELTERGVRRAAEWGWQNIYTYTKSMGDQLVAAAEGIARTIVRPAIVESAERYPFPGWNEGFTTSAPLVYLALKGQNKLPVSPNLILDMVPVDHVAAGMIMIAAQAIVEQPKLVHQLASGDLNPSYIDRVTTLTGLYKRKRFLEKETGNRLVNQLAARMEFRPVAWDEYERSSLPLVNKAADKVSSALEKLRPRWGGGRFADRVDRWKRSVDDVKRVVNEAHSNIELFKPFIHDNEHVFRADNVRALRDRLPPDEQESVRWCPEALDWYDYFLNIHFPGLEKWVLPNLDETYAPKPKAIYGYHDLLELFDATTKLHATRVAMRIARGKSEDVYTYENLQELATRAGAFLVGAGVASGDRVLLFGKNGPEWGMAYFGILKTGATVVPIAHESTVAELVNVARAAGAKGIALGDDLLERRRGLAAALAEAGLDCKLWTFEAVFAIGDLAIEDERRKQLLSRQAPDALASLIFTSGTTGKPKGVMLTHRNFTFMVSELVRVFEFGVTDGMLSVLPLHHTFEFSTGLLVPLARGAQITYLPELTGEAISRALKKGHVTAIVGVPALWDLLRRRVLQRFSDKSSLLEAAVKALASANHELRARAGVDLGVLFFLPVHESFGGRIRYLISGGSALSPEVLKTFTGLGFDFYEGYGLTETAPVLTVTTPKGKPLPGSVGQPLAGVELKVDGPDANGVGEVIARGRNVMAGYWNDEDATRAVLRDGWFHTGDLGRLDEDGNLYLVGRSKDVIIDANGKNVYPDEIEDLYRGCPYIKELAVVGLPEAGTTVEHVAAAVVADREHDPALGRDEVRAKIEAHVRDISSGLPFWKRIKTLEHWDGELPRTSTKKVKRREVVAELLRRQRPDKGAEVARGDEAGPGWLLDVVARVSGRGRADVTLKSSLTELGFDSLMYTELGEALEGAGVTVPEHVDFTAAGDVAGLLAMLTGGMAPPATVRRGRRLELGAVLGDGDLEVPRPVADAGKRLVAFGQRLAYRGLLDTTVEGELHIPQHTNFVAVSNHCSHLDMGALKVALGEAGRNITSLAAADYFFRTKWRRAYFANFTNLVPMERTGSIRKSLEVAEGVLRRGRSMVVFPEGTRSLDGKLATFLPSLGYLALRAEVGILPAHIEGAYDALPKGSAVPKARKLRVRFGPFLPVDLLTALVEGLPQQEGWRLIAALAQRVVEQLRDGVAVRIDRAAIRVAWDGEALGDITPAAPPARADRRAPGEGDRRAADGPHTPAGHRRHE
jgi:long-chain acyl-CoA synthetase